jgi:hypothetical protein
VKSGRPGVKRAASSPLSPQPPCVRGEPLPVPLPGRSAPALHMCPLANSSRMKANATVCIRGESAETFADPEAADRWFKANDPEGVAFEYEVVE